MNKKLFFSRMLQSYLGIMILFGALQVAAKEKITWGIYNVPPYMIQDDPVAGKGIFDQVRGLLQEKLTDFEHQDIKAPWPRVLREVQDEKKWCNIGAIKTPDREEFAYFSLPAAIFMPLKIIVRKDHKGDWKNTQSLESLLKNQNLTTSVMRNRVYGPVVDKLLQTYPPKESYSEQAEAAGMLLAGRIDYMIELPLLAKFQSEEMGRPDELMALSIKESNEVVFNRVMCPKNEWGQKVIDQVNTILRAERPKKYYREIIEKWADETTVEEIRKLYDTVFLKTL